MSLAFQLLKHCHHWSAPCYLQDKSPRSKVEYSKITAKESSCPIQQDQNLLKSTSSLHRARVEVSKIVFYILPMTRASPYSTRNTLSSIPFGLYPQPEIGSEITLRSTGKKEEVTTTCAKKRAHCQLGGLYQRP